jgi:hypothetical protein
MSDGYTDAELRATLGAAEYARYQQQRFLQTLFARPAFADFLRNMVCKFLNESGDPQLMAAAQAIKKEHLDVAAALRTQSRDELAQAAGRKNAP